MQRKYLKYLVLIILLFPVTCYAKTISYDDAKIKFNIDETKWTENELIKDGTYIAKKWTNDCGIIMTGSYDIYNEFSDEELEGVSREYFNYENLLKSRDDAKNILEEFKDTYSVDNWNYKNYKIKFIEFSGKMQQNGINIDYDSYLTVNNGYAFVIQYMRTDILNYGICTNSIEEIVASVESTIPVKKMEDNMNYSILIISLLIGIVLTFICYEAYPFVRVVLMKREYNQQEAKKMALWNSVIVGFIFFLLTVLKNEVATWSIGPALLYYYINEKLWVNKKFKNKLNPKQEELKEGLEKDLEEDEVYFTCDNCGTLVKGSDIECPKCGVLFVDKDNILDDEDGEKPIKSEANMDQKFSDLNKLKKLLDDNIITKEEFEKEKKKILK